MSRRVAALVWLAGACLLASPSAEAQVALTKHNLSVSGPGGIKAASETQICIFCHTPHNSSPSAALWNRGDPGSTYQPYTSSTSQSGAGQPNGSSLLCLSCHDGTIALGNVLSRPSPIAMTGGVSTIPVTAPGYIGTDLSDDHPISFMYSPELAVARGELADPSLLDPRIKLDIAGQIQCTSCHDPHDNTYGKFLVMSNQATALCTSCHVKNFWAQTSHRTSNSTWNGTAPNPWPHTSGSTVAANGCENCHRPHTAGGKSWLMNTATEEDNCYPCHNGNVAQKNVRAEFQKLSIHPVASYTGVHDPMEPGIVQTRHVECVDCHNPHANNGTAVAIPGSLLGVRGIDINGLDVNPVSKEYQICFRCHADSGSMPAPHTARQFAQPNLRLVFSPANPSYHPIAAVGRNPTVPSLLPPWTISSTMNCSDCHNNDVGPGAGGTGPKGPHGSTYARLLERQYITSDRTTESAANYALCYKCHNRTNFITAGIPSVFEGAQGHLLHVVTERTPCNVCHDPHGVVPFGALNNGKLINFDTNVVRPNATTGTLYYNAATKTCTLLCHGDSHNNRPYNN